LARLRVTYTRFEVNETGLERQARPILRRTHSSLTRRIATQARVDVPVRTGHLGRSIREDPQVFTGPFRVTGGVTAHAKYAAAVHEGTRPHVIRPRTAKVLSFVWRGERVAFRRVNHPGTRARPFLRNAAFRVVSSDPRIT
jgi:hypothetical protein